MFYIYLALGGVVGTLARYGLGVWVDSWAAAAGFPWGTLVVNLIGSYVLGFAMRSAELIPISPEVLGLITVGFCGAFTTFSTLSFETVALMQEGVWVRASLYAFGSLGLGLVALMLGLGSASLLIARAI